MTTTAMMRMVVVVLLPPRSTPPEELSLEATQEMHCDRTLTTERPLRHVLPSGPQVARSPPEHTLKRMPEQSSR